MRMNKHTIQYSCNYIVFLKESNTSMYNNIYESQIYVIEWRKPSTKDYVLTDSIVLNFLSITTEADQWLLGRAICRRDYRKCLRKLSVVMDVFTILIIGDGFVSVYICHTQEILHFKYVQLCRLVAQSCQTLLQPHGL